MKLNENNILHIYLFKTIYLFQYSVEAQGATDRHRYKDTKGKRERSNSLFS